MPSKNSVIALTIGLVLLALSAILFVGEKIDLWTLSTNPEKWLGLNCVVLSVVAFMSAYLLRNRENDKK